MSGYDRNESYPLGIHVSVDSWRRFRLQEIAGGWPDGDWRIQAYRRFVDALDRHRSEGERSENPVHATELMCAGVLGEVMNRIWRSYTHDQQPDLLSEAIGEVVQARGAETLDRHRHRFLDAFPPLAEMLGRADREALGLDEYAVTAEWVFRTLQEDNPALETILGILGRPGAEGSPVRRDLMAEIFQKLEEAPPHADLGQPLLDCLRAPAQASPDSIEGQVEWVREHWAHILPPELLGRLRMARDLHRAVRHPRGGGPGPEPVRTFGGDEEGPAAYSRDADWMANVVLVAKSTYVWLHQLSRTWGREITRLDQIPDEELDRLARWGITGLWLIGLWERSRASRRIKQMMGNPEAAASAYALEDYRIADELGGEDAFRDLARRARDRGIRLAGDMVPNHTGIDSRWVIEHPERFVQLPEPPYPSYRFSCEDLCDDPRVGIHIEDGYWDRRDAAVVFQRVDRPTGETRYLYHGNDGTSMPWNDTAQLDFLKPEVREAVIRTIVAVARRFPIIRFDAAMTLARKHFRRLWYPEPGDEGPVPSRVEHGLSKEQFDRRFPVEFWREVVDRVAEEAPDTLLLAEAFWLMEGYFVRTLGMHRVYNSAFMNMLEKEENAGYRASIRNVLAYDPRILERYVNFMNNPDERTAVEQFGRGDKYFGVALMLVTMPGLPMIGHGQVEGFSEKYGMEYRRSYQEEPVDEGMVRRHEREIFPLMRHRRLFSGTAHFHLFDLVTEAGTVDENVFAWSNRWGSERALLVYHNRYGDTRGRIRQACPVNVSTGDEPRLEQRDLCEALGLSREPDHVHLFRDAISGLTRVVPADELARDGLYVELGAYRYAAWVEIEPVHDTDGAWRQLARRLGSAAVADPHGAVQDLRTAPLQEALVEVLQAWIPTAEDRRAPGEAPTGSGSTEPRSSDPSTGSSADPRQDRKRALQSLLRELEQQGVVFDGDPDPPGAMTVHLEAAARWLTETGAGELPPDLREELLAPLDTGGASRARFAGFVMGFAVAAGLRGLPWTRTGSRRELPPGLRLEPAMAKAFSRLGSGGEEAARDARLVFLLLPHITESPPVAWPRARHLDEGLARWLGVNEYEGVRYLNRERLEALLSRWQVLALLPPVRRGEPLGTVAAERARYVAAVRERLEAAGYRVSAL